MMAHYYADTEGLLKTYAPLVRKIAAHVGSRLPANVDLDDLIQEGMTGLLDAIQRYKPQPNQPFESYAAMRIRGAIYDACRRDDWLPRHQRDRLDALQKATRELTHTLGRLPTEPEVAQALQLSLDEFHALVDSLVQVMPLDEVHEDMLPADPDGDPMQQLASQQFARRLSEALQQLPEKQQMVVALHYQEDLSYRQIAAVMGLTAGRISQLHKEAMIAVRALLS